MILLEKLLAGLEVRVEPFAVCDVRGESYLALGPSKRPTVHYTLAGAGTVRVGDGTAIEVRPHTFMIVPPGLRQRIEAAAGSAALRLPAMSSAAALGGLARLSMGSGNHGVILACGTIRATYRGTTGLFDYRDAPIVEAFAEDDPIHGTLEALLAELANPQPGTGAFAEAVMKQCLMLLLRRHCESGECRVAWLSALEDPRLGAAVEAMLDDPTTPHTLARLAAVAGRSRSAFALHFAQAFGRSPMDFLKEIRLRRAAQTLRTTELPVEAVATAVGYASRSYFSRAFKAFHGIDPAGFRAASETRGASARTSLV